MLIDRVQEVAVRLLLHVDLGCEAASRRLHQISSFLSNLYLVVTSLDLCELNAIKFSLP